MVSNLRNKIFQFTFHFFLQMVLHFSKTNKLFTCHPKIYLSSACSVQALAGAEIFNWNIQHKLKTISNYTASHCRQNILLQTLKFIQVDEWCAAALLQTLAKKKLKKKNKPKDNIFKITQSMGSHCWAVKFIYILYCWKPMHAVTNNWSK